MPDRKLPSYPGYDVLSKWHGPSFNDATRRALAKRLAISGPSFFSPDEFAAVEAIAECVVPQAEGRPRIPVAALVDAKLAEGDHDGYRPPTMPLDGDAGRRGLAALDREARLAHGRRLVELERGAREALLRRAEAGELRAAAWGGMNSAEFFHRRLLRDLVLAYYAHPLAWNEIGWGGPASPRGYVRLDFNERDPWEAAEAEECDMTDAQRLNRRVR